LKCLLFRLHLLDDIIFKTRNMKKQSILILAILLMNTGIFAQKSKLNVENNEITIPLNIELKLRVEERDGKLENFQLINQSKVNKPIDMMNALDDLEKVEIISNEIDLKFCYADFLGSKIIVLTTIHHLEKPITFKAKIKIKGISEYIETSIVDIYPNVISIEQWQDEIESIFLYDFKIVTD
jgi:hypothetical protein